MNKAKKSYVYVYYVNKSTPIYVGIGTEDNGKFTRAKQFSLHKYVVKFHKPENIMIRIVARNVLRKTARIIEATLITEFSNHFPICNASCAANTDKMAHLEIKDDKVIKTQRFMARVNTERNPNAAKEREFYILCGERPGDAEWERMCYLMTGFRPKHDLEYAAELDEDEQLSWEEHEAQVEDLAEAQAYHAQAHVLHVKHVLKQRSIEAKKKRTLT